MCACQVKERGKTRFALVHADTYPCISEPPFLDRVTVKDPALSKWERCSSDKLVVTSAYQGCSRIRLLCLPIDVPLFEIISETSRLVACSVRAVILMPTLPEVLANAGFIHQRRWTRSGLL